MQRGICNRDAKTRAGFSLIELLVCFGIILILIGLLVPYFAKGRQRAESIQGVAVFSSIRKIVAAYQTDYQETYPIAKFGTLPGEKSQYYYGPLIRGGYIAKIEDIDPWYRDRNFSSTAMTIAAFLDASYMVPGATLPEAQAPVAAQNASKVLYPSGKGLLWMTPVTASPAGFGSWCCYPGAPRSPVAFDDGSAGEYYWADLLPDGKLYFENGIGAPVGATWYGLRGVDRK